MNGKNQNVSAKEMKKIRNLADFDLVMLISEIHDHGWLVARQTLKLMPPKDKDAPSIPKGHSEELAKNLAKLVSRYRDLYTERKPDISGQHYCKYCYQDVTLEVGPDFSIVICSKCGYGLAPMDELCEHGSYLAWRRHIEEEFRKKYAK